MVNRKRDRWTAKVDEEDDGGRDGAAKAKSALSESRSLAPEAGSSCTSESTANALSSSSSCEPSATLACGGEPAEEGPPGHPLVLGCRSVELYEKISHIDEGTYGIVWKARKIDSKKVGFLFLKTLFFWVIAITLLFLFVFSIVPFIFARPRFHLTSN